MGQSHVFLRSVAESEMGTESLPSSSKHLLCDSHIKLCQMDALERSLALTSPVSAPLKCSPVDALKSKWGCSLFYQDTWIL